MIALLWVQFYGQIHPYQHKVLANNFKAQADVSYIDPRSNHRRISQSNISVDSHSEAPTPAMFIQLQIG
jgi:hypothetical protein